MVDPADNMYRVVKNPPPRSAHFFISNYFLSEPVVANEISENKPKSYLQFTYFYTIFTRSEAV